MSEQTRVDFYGDTRVDTPRFIYRRLAKALHDKSHDRATAISGTIQELLTSPRQEFRRFKFFVPQFLKKFLTPEELAQMDEALAPRRARAGRMKMVYPYVSDEFSLDQDFLASVLDVDHGPQLPRGGRIYTIGSCFATNIARFLVGAGYDAATFGMAEDLNSPISNAVLFDLLKRPPAERRELVMTWLRQLFPEMAEADLPKVAALKLDAIADLGARLAEADCVIMTLGNVVDFFREDAAPSQPLMEKVLPMFVAMPATQEDARTKAAALLKKQGANLRLATTEETREAIAACVAGIRGATRAAIVVTLSPVPINAVLSLGGTTAKSAPEADCISKSRLRSTLDEMMPALQADHGPVHYFPSFEIVRWVAPTLATPLFGLEDAVARHVSGPVLQAVCSLFVDRYVQWAEPAESAQAAALATQA